MALSASHKRWLIIAPVAALVFLGFAATIVTLWRGLTVSDPAPDEVRSMVIDIPREQSYGGAGFGSQIDVSPDGKRLVYIARSDGRQLFVRSLDSSESRVVPGTQGANDPAFSPDGKQVAFISDGLLKTVPLDGGEVKTIGRATTTRGIAWFENDTFILGNARGGLLRLTLTQMDPVPLVRPTQYGPEALHLWPQVLPGGKAILFTRTNRSLDASRISLLSLETGEEQTVLETNGHWARYARTGHIVFVHNHVVMAARFDVDRLKAIGSAQRVLEDEVNGGGQGATDLSFSQDGLLIFTRRDPSPFDELMAGIGGYNLKQIHVTPGWFDELRRVN